MKPCELCNSFHNVDRYETYFDEIPLHMVNYYCQDCIQHQKLDFLAIILVLFLIFLGVALSLSLTY